VCGLGSVCLDAPGCEVGINSIDGGQLEFFLQQLIVRGHLLMPPRLRQWQQGFHSGNRHHVSDIGDRMEPVRWHIEQVPFLLHALQRWSREEVGKLTDLRTSMLCGVMGVKRVMRFILFTAIITSCDHPVLLPLYDRTPGRLVLELMWVSMLSDYMPTVAWCGVRGCLVLVKPKSGASSSNREVQLGILHLDICSGILPFLVRMSPVLKIWQGSKVPVEERLEFVMAQQSVKIGVRIAEL
jgi:hypothetical protein